MAYFSNGTEGMDYESKYCDRCANNREHPGEPLGDDPSCAVWDLHLHYNYTQHRQTELGKAIKHVLASLIPTPKDSVWPGECLMFLERAPQDSPERVYLRKLQDGVDVITAIAERDVSC